MIDSTIHLGPFNIPVLFLTVLFSLAVSFAISLFPLRGHKLERKLFGNIISNAILVFIVVWKLSPLITNFDLVSKEWILILYYPGHIINIVLGALAAATYIAIMQILKRYPKRLFFTILLFSAVFSLVFFLSYAVLSVPAETQVSGSIPEMGVDLNQKAPDFTLQSLKGEDIALSAVKKDVIIINFWATWCPPCRAEIPEINRFHDQFKDKNLEILAVNLTGSEKNLENVRSFVGQKMMKETILLDKSNYVASLYGVASIPTTFVLDAKGIIRAKKVGPVSYDWLLNNFRRITRD